MSYKIRVFKNKLLDGKEFFTAQLELRRRSFIFSKTEKVDVLNLDLTRYAERYHFASYDVAYNRAMEVLIANYPEFCTTKQEVTQ